jgi:hypothetical protein
MKAFRLAFFVVIAFAISGAPFGMGRMMDQAHAHQTMHAAHGMNHGEMPTHKSSSPHYMICAACVAAGVPDLSSYDPVVLNATLNVSEPSAMEGAHLLPPLPPPRTLIRIV